MNRLAINHDRGRRPAQTPIKKGKEVTKMNLQTCVAMAVVAFILAAPTGARADAVGDWNAITVQATITGARPGPTGFLDVAVVQAAVYDAVQAIEGQYRPYAVEIPGATGSSVAATAKAAHDVLVNRFPAQTAPLDMTYEQYLIDEGIPTVGPWNTGRRGCRRRHHLPANR